VRQLKMSIESKDRYACWVCNRAHERQDESAEGSDAGEDSDKHDECVMMRRRLVEMEEEIRELTGEGGAAETSEPAQAKAQEPAADTGDVDFKSVTL
ncbi:PRKG2, partial [Symbiodinium sp. KB8]